MKQSILLLVTLAAALCYQSCYEDKGKYDYLPVNSVTIEATIPLTAYLGETFRFMPTITFEDPTDTTGFEYWWENKGNMGLLNHHEIICEGRELQFVPPLVGSQTVQLCVRETRTGYITTQNFSINGASRYAKGWLILREEAGESKLSFVLPERSVPGDNASARVYTPYVDLYGQLFPGVPLGTGPVAIRQGFSGRGIGSIFYILQANESACFNGVSYQRELLLSQEFIGGVPAGLSPRDYYQNNYANMLVNADGTVYYRSPFNGSYTDFFTYSFANFPMEYRGEPLKIDRVIPAVAFYSFFFAILDTEHKRFLWVYAGHATTGGGMLPAPSFTLPGEYLDYNDTGDAEILYTAFYNEALVGSQGQTYNITLYRRDGNVYVQRCRGTGGQQLTVLPATQPLYDFLNDAFSGKDYVSSGTRYYQLETRTYLFFATGNNLYWYDHLGKTTRLFYTFPAGSEVLKMDSNPQESELGVVLTSGKFVTLNIEDSRLMESDNKLYEIDLPGTIVDMEYKFPALNSYQNRASGSSWD
jgi:hypothetical protein